MAVPDAVPFVLTPFQPVSDLAVAGKIVRSYPWLTVEYRLTGTLDSIELPPAGPGQRRDGLWQTTCFELFLAEPGSQRYWEVNAAPSGDWNVYTFDGYRRGMVPEIRCDRVDLSHRQQGASHQVTLRLLLDWLDIDASLQASVTAVIDAERLSYWAITHPGQQPDFHHRAGFCLKI